MAEQNSHPRHPRGMNSTSMMLASYFIKSSADKGALVFRVSASVPKEEEGYVFVSREIGNTQSTRMRQGVARNLFVGMRKVRHTPRLSLVS